ncbi:U1 small nuclear ribonucleoprotein 70 kDa [Pelomyxa schiedti]|nr:U1 small nuclear ribonucleoprotein 70 kDa [Pelomyxa schiedti]
MERSTSTGMAQYLPPQLLAMFAPRAPIPFAAPIEKRKMPPYSGVAQFMNKFETTPPVFDGTVSTAGETRDQRKARRLREKQERAAALIEEKVTEWDPFNNPQATQDAYRTLFVARINYDSTEQKLRREFEAYGPVNKVRLVMDTKTKKPRGYAFIEFEKERDMRTAWKQGDGKKIDGRRVLVDVERGRTVRGWRPRRLGGGMGKTRAGGEEVNQKHSGREPTSDEHSGHRHHSEHHRSHPHHHRSASRERSRDRGERERSKSHSRSRSHSHSPVAIKKELPPPVPTTLPEPDRERDRERGDNRDRERDSNKDRDHHRHGHSERSGQRAERKYSPYSRR